MSILRLLLLVVLLAQDASAFAQSDPLNDLEDELAGLWLVEVSGARRPRLLKIHGLEQKSRGVFLLEADYGWYSGEKRRIGAELVYASGELMLTLVTPDGNRITARQEPTGEFAGAFALLNGRTRNVTITKVPPAEVEAMQRAELNAVPDIQQPSADVPAACASFIGGWTGVVPNDGRFWLWVVEADRSCGVKYSYGASQTVPLEFMAGEIRNGVLTVPRLKGHAAFEIQGAGLVRKMFGTGGAGTPVAFHKVNTTDGSLAMLRSAQVADRPSAIPPGADVPPACAAFFGTWAGTWPRGRKHWLHVFSVDAKCSASYSYTLGSSPRIFYPAQIRDGLLTFRCNENRPAICNFRRRGNVLDAQADSGRNSNTAVFDKVE